MNLKRQAHSISKIFFIFEDPLFYFGDKVNFFGDGKDVLVKLKNGLKLKIRTGNSDINTITDFYFSKEYVNFMESIDAGQTFVDLGANFGFLSLLAAKRGAKTFSFEPHPRLFETLKENFKINDLLGNFLNYGVSGNGGNLKLYFHNDKNSLGGSILKNDFMGNNVGFYDIRTITFERIFSLCGIDHIDFLKMDIEGAEEEVVNTIKPAVFKKIGKMYIEYHEPRVDVSAIIRKIAPTHKVTMIKEPQAIICERVK